MEAASSPVHVLLVDDDEDEHIIVGDLLRSPNWAQFELACVSTYDEGLEAILSSAFDVCLVDYRLGIRSGLDLVREAIAKQGAAQIILLTGEGDREIDMAATSIGAADYLLKGELTASMLERSIRYAVERGRTLKALRHATELAKCATEAAEGANRAKSEFLATMSHEIRTPMNAVLGMADMLAESQLDSVQKHYLDVVQGAGSTLLSLINDILDLSKIEAGQLEFEHIEFDLEDAADQAVELMGVKARAKGIALMCHFSPGVTLNVVGDPTRLKQVLINLLGNAVKFTDAGEVVLTLRNSESGKPGEIDFAVSDTGIGIPPDKLETVFQKFAQVDQSTTRKYGGSGLGLEISRRLVERMEGRLTVTSVVGKGSTFSFNAQFDLGTQAARKAAGAENLRGRRVLVIGANITNRAILGETFNAWELESTQFDSAEAALENISSAISGNRAFALALIDGDMPGMDGLEIAARIKKIAPRLPVVSLLPFEVRPGDALRRREVGAWPHAVKPVNRSVLLRLIGSAMNARQGDEPRLPGIREGETKSVKPLRILIAEDSADNRLLLRAFLKNSSHELTFVEDGIAVVDRFAAGDFDVIVMDIQMQLMDGLAATRAIRELERERGAVPIAIIALTANSLPHDAAMSREAGCNFHLSKPFSKIQLLRALNEYTPHGTPAAPAPSYLAGERLTEVSPS